MDSEHEITKGIFENLLNGNFEKVGEDAYKLSDKGMAEAELMLRDPEALRLMWQLTAGHAELSAEQHEMLNKCVSDILDELSHMKRWMGALAAFAEHLSEQEPENAPLWIKVKDMATSDPRDAAATEK